MKKNLEAIPFNAKDALSRAKKVMTKSGKKVTVICETRGELYCFVKGYTGSHYDSYVKYQMNGQRYKNSESNEDLVMYEK